MRLQPWALGLMLLAACGDDAEVTDSGTDGGLCGCTGWGAAHRMGALSAPLVELSGLVASRTQPGVLYAHSDSGSAARFYALTATLALRETFTLDDADAVDWEDVAIGPCPSGTCLFLGDIGDNELVRDDYALFRVPEPRVTSGRASVAWERLPFRYPDGAHHDAESLLVHPVSGRAYLITKEDSGPSEVFRFPRSLEATSTATLEPVTTLTIPTEDDGRVTAADVNPCGTSVLVRLANRLVEYRLPATATDFESVFSYSPITVPSADEEQSEAVAYAPDGRGYFTAGEAGSSEAGLYAHQCQ